MKSTSRSPQGRLGLFFTLSAAALFIVGAACGTSKDDTEVTPEPVAQQPEPTTPAPTEPTTPAPTEPTTPTAACDAVAQTGCTGDASKCGIVGNRYGCQAPGTAAFGEACEYSATGDTCAAGLFCNNAKCDRFCTTDANCGENQKCSQTVTWNNGPPQGEVFKICVAVDNECEPLLQDCANAALGCFVTDAGNKCLQPGTTTDGAVCDSANDCLKGSTCYNSGSGFICSAMCTPAPANGTGPGTGTGGTDNGSGTGTGEEEDDEAPAPVACAAGACVGITSTNYGVCR